MFVKIVLWLKSDALADDNLVVLSASVVVSWVVELTGDSFLKTLIGSQFRRNKIFEMINHKYHSIVDKKVRDENIARISIRITCNALFHDCQNTKIMNDAYIRVCL
jgi:hypothetical protein